MKLSEFNLYGINLLYCGIQKRLNIIHKNVLPDELFTENQKFKQNNIKLKLIICNAGKRPYLFVYIYNYVTLKFVLNILQSQIQSFHHRKINGNFKMSFVIPSYFADGDDFFEF